MPATLSPQEFVAKWRRIASDRQTSQERRWYQRHFEDLCQLIGHETPDNYPRRDRIFTFEAGAKKLNGGRGWADVYLEGRFGWEYKDNRANLDKAYQQLLQYRESLNNPPLLVVSNFEHIIIHTNFNNTVKRNHELQLKDLLTTEGRDMLHAVFYDPEHFKVPRTKAQVTQDAAREFASLADILRKWDEDPDQIARYLIRILFSLFAEDIGLLPKDIFTWLIEQARGDSLAFTRQLGQLFQQMAQGGWFGPYPIRHFNGGLFDDDFTLELPSDGLQILADVCRLDWSSIEPSILGTLFERSLDPSKRAQLGAHYTSREDILLVVEPVLMKPLRNKWEKVKNEVMMLVAEANPDAPLDDQRRNAIYALLDNFIRELSSLRVLDAAAGSGNFLYISLRELLDLEKKAITLAYELGIADFKKPRVSPTQLYGVEVNEYAAKLAQATVWIGYIQWLNENGFALDDEPILQRLDNVQCRDAILDFDEESHPVEPEWPEADVLIGNPPFLGDKLMRGELGHQYVEDLRSLYAGRLPGQSDLVCYWFEKARDMIEAGKLKRAGLLATQGIRGGANRAVLERIKKIGDIFWAQSDRDWILEGANVHVSMIGFDNGLEVPRFLDGRKVSVINSDLTSSADLTKAKPLKENRGIAFIGSQKGGSFDISAGLAQEILEKTGNPNGRPNSDVIRPWINGLDISRRSRNMWIIDFGRSTSVEEAAQYEEPFEYVRNNVYPHRKHLRRKNHRVHWWIHAESRPGMREALDNLERYIVTPRVAKYRLFIWQPTEVLADSAVVAIARHDDYFFGILHSRLHELWALRQGTALEDRPRYTPTTTFETFPFPWPPGQEPADDPNVQAIAAVARELVEKRDAWLNPPGASQQELKRRTLTNLYNQRPTWLDLAHQKLDAAVLDAYGWPHELSDEEILERLLGLNLERAAV